MKYLRHILIGIVVLTTLLYDFSQSELSITICLALILIFGIPHGAIDHKIHFSVTKNSNLTWFVLKYLAVAASYVLVWIFRPDIALLIFLVISAYHFGQELLENYKINSSVWFSMLAGMFIVFAPIFYHYGESKVFLDVIASNLFPALSVRSTILIAIVITIVFLCVITYYWFAGKISRSQYLNIFLFISSITFLNLTLNFLYAFTIYFILFHSLNAFRHQFNWLKKKDSSYNLGRLFIDLLGFSVLAILGILALLWFLKPESTQELVSYFFILTSLITLPHVITLDQFYKNKKEKSKRMDKSDYVISSKTWFNTSSSSSDK